MAHLAESDTSSMNPKLMGVVNVTPDSFSDGGRYLDAEAAIAHGEKLSKDGAEILDVGGESTRPGRSKWMRRRSCAGSSLWSKRLAGEATVSIDTSKLAVAEAALDAGASIVNDVTALRRDPEIAALCAERGAGVVLMHMPGNPRTMQDEPRLRGCGRRRQGVPGGADRGGACRWGRGGADLARPRDRLRQDARAQPRAAAAARPSCASWGGPW